MTLKLALSAATALPLLYSAACADEASIEKRLDQMQRMIESQQRQIEQQTREIKVLRGALRKKGASIEAAEAPAPQPMQQAKAQPAPSSSAEERLAAQQEQINQLNQRIENNEAQARIAEQEKPVWSLAGGRPTVQSPDGRFSLAIRALTQFDVAYYMQSSGASALPLQYGPDLSSGTNFRRAQLGIQGKLFGDWSYFFNTEFGGSNGTESGGRVQSAFVQYDGLLPFAFRIGAYPPAAGLEDNTSSSDTLFLERAAPSDIIRNAVGGDGRDAASLLYLGNEFYAALSYTGGKVGDAAVFDEQNSLLGRVADSLYSDSNSRLVVSATGAWMFRAPDSAPGSNAPRNLTLAVAPELTVDSTGTKLVSTGGLNTDKAKFWGAEIGGTWNNLYAQGGYFRYDLSQRVVPPALAKPDLNFDGWYMQASWVITGEPKGYNTSNAAFTPPKPRIPFSLNSGGWGAWELAGRYSEVDLNDDAGLLGLAVPYGGVRGGDQRIWTLGVNWYPNSALRFALDYQWIDVSRLDPTGLDVGQNLSAVSLRSQLSL